VTDIRIREAKIKGSDVVVVGGGLVGCAIAREAALRGARVCLLERAAPAAEASWAAAGMLAPLSESERPGPFFRLSRESLALFPRFVAALQEETGLDACFRRSGKLLVALSGEESAALDQRRAWLAAEGLPNRMLDGPELRSLEPLVAGEAEAALLLEGDALVDNRALGRAAWGAAAAAGVRMLTGQAVSGVHIRKGRVAGLHLRGGGRLEAARVVLSAGAWSGQLSGLPRPLPVFPVRGQMIAIAGWSGGEAGGEHLVSGAGVYLVPRSAGGERRMWVGATMEHVGFEKRTTTAGRTCLHEGALRLMPGLEGAPVVEHWAGLRPATPDGLPILGADPEADGLLYATGHFRNGILLTPVTARITADLLEGGSPAGLEAFHVSRFAPDGTVLPAH